MIALKWHLDLRWRGRATRVFNRVTFMVRRAKDETGSLPVYLLLSRYGCSWIMVLWLNCTRVDAMMMQCLPDFCGYRHKVMVSGCKYMYRGDNFGFG